jgi:hypothetical protein
MHIDLLYRIPRNHAPHPSSVDTTQFEGLDLTPLDPTLLGGARDFTLRDGFFYSGVTL